MDRPKFPKPIRVTFEDEEYVEQLLRKKDEEKPNMSYDPARLSVGDLNKDVRKPNRSDSISSISSISSDDTHKSKYSKRKLPSPPKFVNKPNVFKDEKHDSSSASFSNENNGTDEINTEVDGPPISSEEYPKPNTRKPPPPIPDDKWELPPKPNRPSKPGQNSAERIFLEAANEQDSTSDGKSSPVRNLQPPIPPKHSYRRQVRQPEPPPQRQSFVDECDTDQTYWRNAEDATSKDDVPNIPRKPTFMDSTSSMPANSTNELPKPRKDSNRSFPRPLSELPPKPRPRTESFNSTTSAPSVLQPPPVPPHRSNNTHSSHSDSDSDSDSEREGDYLRVIKYETDHYISLNDDLKGIDKFQLIKNRLLDAENDFIAEYAEVSKGSSFNNILEKGKTTAMRIFGNVKAILDFHTELRESLNKAKNSTELAHVFIANEDNLRLHVTDQWKLCQSENTEGLIKHHMPVYGTEFPGASQAIISTYKNELNHISKMENGINQTVEHSKKILINVVQQIVYINLALKIIIDPNINLVDCGEVLHLGRYLVKKQRTVRWKKMDIYFMERCIVFAIMKKRKLYFVNSFPADSIQFACKEKEQIINLYTVHGKKLLLMIKFDKKNSYEFEEVSYTLHILSGM